MDVIAGAVGPAASGGGYELGELGVEIAPGDDTAGFDDVHGLAHLGFEEVSAQVSAAAASGAAGNHRVRPLA